MTRALAVAVVAAGLALAGCGGAQSPGSALSSWTSSSQLANAAGTLLNDSGAVRDAIHQHRAASVVKTVCAELLLDAQGANNELPTPDAQLTGLLSGAYDQFAKAASRCYAASGTPVALSRADAIRVGALGLLVAAVLRAEAVLGRPLHVRGIP